MRLLKTHFKIEDFSYFSILDYNYDIKCKFNDKLIVIDAKGTKGKLHLWICDHEIHTNNQFQFRSIVRDLGPFRRTHLGIEQKWAFFKS